MLLGIIFLNVQMMSEYEIESKKINKCPCKECDNEIYCFDKDESCNKYFEWHKRMKRKKD